jgi:hypothetical protein
MDYPEKRTVRWIDDDTGEEVGSCEYIRCDLYADLLQAANELAKAAEKQFDNLNAWLRNPDADKAKRSIKADDAFIIALAAYQQAKEETK